MISAFNKFRNYNFKIQHQKSLQMQNLAVRIWINPLPPRCQEERALEITTAMATNLNISWSKTMISARALSILIYLFAILYDMRTSAQDA